MDHLQLWLLSRTSRTSIPHSHSEMLQTMVSFCNVRPALVRTMS